MVGRRGAPVPHLGTDTLVLHQDTWGWALTTDERRPLQGYQPDRSRRKAFASASLGLEAPVLGWQGPGVGCRLGWPFHRSVTLPACEHAFSLESCSRNFCSEFFQLSA